MNSLLVLFLWGFIAYSTAAPSCSDEEINKCGPVESLPWKKIWAEGEREVEALCSEFLPTMQCREGFAERCTNTDEAKYLNCYRENVKLFGEMCDKSKNFRDEYLKNIPCINDNLVDIVLKKCSKMYPKDEDEDLCSYSYRLLGCNIQQVEETCGEQGRHVFEKISEPLLFCNAAFCN